MSTADSLTRTQWRLVGEQVGTCNCDWACPCQFNDVRPTHGFCEALVTFQISEGHFGETSLDGVRFAWVLHWPGPVHEGNGTRMLVLDEGTTAEQRAALTAMTNGTEGHPFFEIFTSVTPNVVDAVTAPIHLEMDAGARTATVRIEGLAENEVEPIGGATDTPLRIRLDLPNGFEFKIAEIANAVRWKVLGRPPLAMEHERTYTHLIKIDWDSEGAVR
jgi:hypothetical protein